MGQPKTLVVILCMHRCGSSLTARLLARLGMSLGPYELGESNESNKYGHFEAQPFVMLNREFQLRHFGFEGDLPDSEESFNRYCASDGRWPTTDDLSDTAIARGRDLIKDLLSSGEVCGFKDPRTVLVWPFWQRVLAELSDVRIVLLLLVREPHEIATSIFRRSHGDRDYAQALDVTAIHFRGMSRILHDWRGPAAVVQFAPQVYATQVRPAVELCGLSWSEEALADAYDATCRHCEPARVAHPAQVAFDSLMGAAPAELKVGDWHRLLADAAAREVILKQRRDLYRRERDVARREILALGQELAGAQRMLTVAPTRAAENTAGAMIVDNAHSVHHATPLSNG